MTTKKKNGWILNILEHRDFHLTKRSHCLKSEKCHSEAQTLEYLVPSWCLFKKVWRGAALMEEVPHYRHAFNI